VETWKRNLAVVWVAELLAIAGFSVAFPFLPYYVQELGITEPGQVELWSGILVAVQGVTMMIFSPIWGSLADRYGRKIMIQRATFGGAAVMTAMAFVQNVEQLALLRALQGVLTGTVAAAMTLVASGTPRERTGYALGMLQMAVWLGSSLGPPLGGLIADWAGYRAVFIVTGALLLVAGFTVWLLVKEDFTPVPREEGEQAGGAFFEGVRLVVRAPALVALFTVRIAVRLGTSIVTPILPLFVQSLLASPERVASTTGLITGVAAGMSAVSAVLLGRASDRVGYRRMLLATLTATMLTYVPHFFVTTPGQLLVLQAVQGFALGGMLAVINAMLANRSPEGRQGAVYGLDASVTAGASAVGPMIGAAVAASMGLRATFLLAAGAMGLALGVAWARIPRMDRSKPVPRPVAWNFGHRPWRNKRKG
jgi:DHA1 family multidrug resistance protein-like MFS transporter